MHYIDTLIVLMMYLNSNISMQEHTQINILQFHLVNFLMKLFSAIIFLHIPFIFLKILSTPNFFNQQELPSP